MNISQPGGLIKSSSWMEEERYLLLSVYYKVLNQKNSKKEYFYLPLNSKSYK